MSYGLGFSFKQQIKCLLLTTLTAITFGAKRAPKRIYPNSKPLYFDWPIFGELGYYRKALTDCPVRLLIEEGKARNYQVSELCLFGGLHDIYVFDRTNIEYILRVHWRNFTKNHPKSIGFEDFFTELLGRGIFDTDGFEWASHLKTSLKTAQQYLNFGISSIVTCFPLSTC